MLLLRYLRPVANEIKAKMNQRLNASFNKKKGVKYFKIFIQQLQENIDSSAMIKNHKILKKIIMQIPKKSSHNTTNFGKQDNQIPRIFTLIIIFIKLMFEKVFSNI